MTPARLVFAAACVQVATSTARRPTSSMSHKPTYVPSTNPNMPHQPTYVLSHTNRAPSIYPLSAYQTLLTGKNGDSLTVSAINGDTFVGTLVRSNGDEFKGQFKKNKEGNFVLDGQGSRTFKDTGTKDAGEYDNGVFVDGTVWSSDGSIHIGTRWDYRLDGDLCIKIFPNGNVQIGEVRGNDFIKGYENGNQVISGKVIPFDPYTFPPLPPFEEKLATLTKEVREIKGDQYEGFFVGDRMIFGTRFEGGSAVHSGFFDKKGILEGLGTRSFIDQQTNKPFAIESGMYGNNGRFISGRVDYPSGKVEIGPRYNMMLHGENCTIITVTGRVYRGFVDKGQMSNGITTYSKTFEINHASFEQFTHQAETRPDGLVHYSVNGIEVFKGTSLATPECEGILNDQQTPLLVDLKKIELFIHFLSIQEKVAHEAFDSFLMALPERASRGEKIAARFLESPDCKGSLVLFKYASWKKLSVELPKLSRSDQLDFSFFIAQKAVRELGEESCREMCVKFSAIMLSNTLFAQTGLQTFTRSEDTIVDTRDFGRTAVFATYLENLNEHMKMELPHIEPLAILRYTVEDGKNSIGMGLHVSNREQFSSLFNVFFSGQHASLGDVLGYDPYRATGFGYRIPKEAIQYFVGDQPRHIVFGEVFFRLDANTPEDVKARLDRWRECASPIYERVDTVVRCGMEGESAWRGCLANLISQKVPS